MPTFLLKTEPGEFSFDDLVAKKLATWDGVANPGALATLRTIRKGDELLIYHTGDEKAIVGIAIATSDPYEDPKQRGLTPDGKPKFAVLDVKPLRTGKTDAHGRVPKPVTLAAIKADARFKDFALVRQARLSVMAVPVELDRAIRALAGP